MLKQFEPNLEYIPEVKNTLREELKKRKKNQYHDYWHTRHIYTEMLEYMHTRYDPDRLDNPTRSLELAPYEKKLMTEQENIRAPVELERRFLEILYLIIKDSWQIPKG